MALLEINQTRRITASIRLDESTAAQIDQYAAFLQAPADEIVDKALGYVFAKDREFQDFLRTDGAAQVPQSLRIRHKGRGPVFQSLLRRQSKRAKAVEAKNEERARS
jgi:hypothetical protein